MVECRLHVMSAPSAVEPAVPNVFVADVVLRGGSESTKQRTCDQQTRYVVHERQKTWGTSRGGSISRMLGGTGGRLSVIVE